MNATYNPLVWQVVLLGADSLVGGLAFGALLGRWRDRLALAMLFGVCDGVGSLVGGMLPHAFPDIPDALLYGLAVALIALSARHSRHWLFAAPFIFALDNLASGLPASSVPMLAISSGLLALVGIIASVCLVRAAQRLYSQTVALRVRFTHG